MVSLALTACHSGRECDITAHKTFPIQNYCPGRFLIIYKDQHPSTPQPAPTIPTMADAVVEATAEKRKAPIMGLRESTKRTRVERQVIGKGNNLKSSPTTADKK